jgi:5-methyltetrahydropteroyltriglutamate--homocysteine methyltransferase
MAERLRAEVAEVVRKQVSLGIDGVNDGEFSKANFTVYVRQRLGGFSSRPAMPGEPRHGAGITGREMCEFADYFATHDFFGHPIGPNSVAVSASPPTRYICTGPLRYRGQDSVQTDVTNLKAAVAATTVSEAFIPAIAPGVIEHWLQNEFYKSDEEFVFAIAEALREEYTAIAGTGFTIQIDAPDLLDAWEIYPDMSVEAYRRHTQIRVEALNHALRGIPEAQIRLHACWGSGHGPHKYDLPLREIVDVLFSVRAGCYSIEASNPRHEHEWTVFEDVKLPDGAVLIPGVAGHHSDFIEHPELIAQRLVRYARLIGRENVVAGTDCGLGLRVGHENIAWAKFESMAEGARIASRELWRH